MSGVGTQTVPDVTGQVAYGQDGYEIGTVVGVYLDNVTRQPEWAAVDLDGSELTLVPLAGATPTASGVQLAFGWQDVNDAPYRAAELPRAVADDDEVELYRHYRLQSSPPPRRRRRSPPSTSAAARSAGREVASSATEQGQQVASAAADEAQQVAKAAATQARDVASTAREEAAQVSEELSQEAQSLLEETKGQLEAQAQAQAERLAETLRRFGGQAQALADGRPTQAGPLPAYMRDAAGRLEQLADDIDARGVGGLLEDLQSFARRRPGVFLLGAAAVGFGVGRLIRAKSSDDDEAELSAPSSAPARRRPVRAAGGGR